MPKVSIIIPVYNVEKYLHQCMDSIINQTLKDIEIICVDDGSTDNSLKILKEYAQKDNRIIVLTQENSGAGAARNLGMKHATGSYLSILDSDDYFDHTMLELLYKKAEKTKTDITICRSQHLDEKTKNIEPMPWSLKTNFLPEKEVFNYKDVLDHVFDFCIGWSWDKLYKTSFIKETQLEFQNLRSTNDAFFVFMSLLHAKKITTIENILITHRKNTFTSLSETRDKDPNCFLTAVIEMKKYMEEKGFYNSVKKSFLNWFCDFSFWHLDTLQNQENKKQLKKHLTKTIFKKFGIYDLEEEFFYNKKLYQRIHFGKINKEQISRLLKGILDNLQIAEEKNLPTLKNTTYQHLIDHLPLIRKKLNRSHKNMLKTIQAYFPNENILFSSNTPFYQKIFSIKKSNDKRYKIIRLFGLRIKFKRKKFGGCSLIEHLASIKNSKDKRYKIIRLLGLRIKIKHNKKIKINKNNNGNKIILIHPNGKQENITSYPGLHIKFIGLNNVIKIHLPIRFENCIMELGHKNEVIIQKNCFFKNVSFLITSSKCICSIGEKLSYHGGILSLRNKPETKISIGNNCLFSSDVIFRTSDGHTIYDINTHEIQNMDEDICIGNNIWICHNVSILKGVNICDNNIIGTGAIISKNINKSNCVWGGINNCIKENVMWDVTSPEKFNKNL